jgi:asparagine synthase (glutamine-hydrolysing)
MCGIAGIISKGVLRPEQAGAVFAMTSALAHRGPDGQGYIRADHVAIGVRRLSINDVQGGSQPLYNEDKSLALVCNGEIYNHVELRRELQERGHRFATRNDCESILHLYEEAGDQCVHSLRGMYAFALWDRTKRRVLLARDRMAEKPLYLVETPTSIVFASELKALISTGVVPFDLDPNAIHLYFHYGYVPEPLCIVQNVRKLPAAHLMTVDVNRWQIRQRRYWRAADAPPLDGDPAELIRTELERIGELVVRSDVPVGVALSGGLDSSVVATLAARKYPGTLQAVTLGYAGHPRQDERKDARALADHLQIPTHEIELHAEDVARTLPEIAWHCDDPVADIAAPSYYYIMQRARDEGLRVMLDGQGGDELFWGYGWVRDAVRATERKQRLRLNGSSAWREYLQVARPPYSYTGGMRWLKEGAGLRAGIRQRAADLASPSGRMVFYDLTPGFQTAMAGVRELYTSEFLSHIREGCEFDLFTLPEPWPAVDGEITRLICESYLFENGIAQSDRLSMASSVELRLPLVDHRLVEIVTGLRKSQRDVDSGPKKWLRDAVRDIVPEFVLKRPKRGFSPPWRQWARATAERYSDEVADGYLVAHGILSPAAGRALADRLTVSAWSVPWSLADSSLTLELWCRAMSTAAARELPVAPTSHAPEVHTVSG